MEKNIGKILTVQCKHLQDHYLFWHDDRVKLVYDSMNMGTKLYQEIFGPKLLKLSLLQDTNFDFYCISLWMMLISSFKGAGIVYFLKVASLSVPYVEWDTKNWNHIENIYKTVSHDLSVFFRWFEKFDAKKYILLSLSFYLNFAVQKYGFLM